MIGDEVSARAPVRGVAHPETRLLRLARQRTDDGGTIIGICAVLLELIRTPGPRIRGVAMRPELFPPAC